MKYIPYLMAIAIGLFIVVIAAQALMDGAFHPIEDAFAVCSPAITLVLFRWAGRSVRREPVKRK